MKLKALFIALSLISTYVVSEVTTWYLPNEGQTDKYTADLLKDIEGYGDTSSVLRKYESTFNELIGRSATIQKQQFSKKEELLADKRDLTLYFATFNMSRVALKGLFYSAIENDGIIIFRGLKNKNGSIGATSRFVHSLVADFKFKKTPNVTLNPVLFNRYMITKSPSIVIQKKGDMGSYKVSGIVDSKWLLEKIEDKVIKDGPLEKGYMHDFGTRGNIINITEKDLIAEMKDRVRTYDWEKAKTKAFDSFMAKMKFIDLPKAEDNKAFKLDMSIVSTRDILDDKGNLLVKKGTRINPTNYMTLSSYIVVFDGTDEAEIKYAESVRARGEADNRPVKLIVTKFPLVNGGWKDLQILRDRLGGKVFKLDKTFKTRFQVNSTPSVIYMRDSEVYIEEVKL